VKYIEGHDRNQLVLFPERLDELVLEDNPVRAIDAFVEYINVEATGLKRAKLEKESPGRPSYSPKSLLKLYIYGYFKKVRSSRKLMELCHTNIEVMWLMERLTPDFRTISDFRKDNASSIKSVFKAFVKVCIEMGLYNKEIGVQDGSKFRAVNSKDNNVTKPKLLKKMEMVDEKIAKYLEEMDKNDREEVDSQKYSGEEITEILTKLKERKEQYNKLLMEMKEEGSTQRSFTDPESKLMKTANGGFDVCYNAQIIVDRDSHLIGAFEITNQCNDIGLLSEITANAKEDLGADVMEIVADKGYEDTDDIIECLMNGTIAHIPSKTGKEFYEFDIDYKEDSITEEILDSRKPEAIRACLEAGLIPNIYKGKGIEVSVYEVEQYVYEESFRLNEEGTAVVCPSGAILKKVSRLHQKGKTRFVNKAACTKCPDKCTTSKFRQVDLHDEQTVLHVKKLKIVKKVKVKLTPDKEKIRTRKCVVEHPFGTVKRWMDGSYLLLKGKEKAGADMALLFLTYNIKRVINMIGTQALIDKMREIMGFFRALIFNLSEPRTLYSKQV
jgi:transposase